MFNWKFFILFSVLFLILILGVVGYKGNQLVKKGQSLSNGRSGREIKFDTRSGNIIAGNIGQKVYTFDEVWADRERLLGQELYISAKVIRNQVSCTLVLCSPKDPCCNSCSGGYFLSSETSDETEGSTLEHKGLPYIELQSENKLKNTIGCRGDTCILICSPFEFGKNYIILGQFGFDKYPKYNNSLNLENGHYYLNYKGHKAI